MLKVHFFLQTASLKFCFHHHLGDTVVPRRGKTHGLKIYYRFHFSSALKRMSVIAGHTPPGSTDVEYIATVKGAPEVVRNMVSRALGTRGRYRPDYRNSLFICMAGHHLRQVYGMAIVLKHLPPVHHFIKSLIN